MNWVTVIWSMVASACLTLAAVHLLAWCQRRSQWAHLLFSIAAVGTAGVSAVELWMMHAATPGQFATAVRWLHVPMWALFVALVGVVRVYLRAGRPWLAWTVCATRTVSLLANFLAGQNLNYLEITHLRSIPFLGQSVAVAEGVPNPWMALGQLSLYLFVIFAADAAVTAWRRGDRSRALTMGGSIVFFMFVGAVHSVLYVRGFVGIPFAASLCSLGVVAAMAWELSRDAVQAARLADDLLDSEARYRGIFDGAVEGMFRTTVSGRLLLANHAMARMLGYGSTDETVREIDDTARQVWAEPADRDRYVQLLAERGTVSGYECQFKRKDGTRVWVSLSTRAVPGPDGRTACFDGFVTDISPRKQAEKALRESEAFARSTLNGLSAHIAIIDESGVILSVNRAWRDFADANPPVRGNVCEGANYLDVCDGAASEAPEAAPFAGAIRSILKGSAENFDLEYSCHSPVERRWFVGRVTRLPDSPVPRVVVAHEDITDQKRAEQELMSIQDRLATGVDLAGLGFYEMTDGEEVSYTDDRMRAIFGIPRDMEYGGSILRFWFEHLHLDDGPRLRGIHQQMLNGKIDQISVEYRYRHPDGRDAWIHHRAIVTGRDSAGRSTRQVGVVRDITEQKMAEDQLRASEALNRTAFEQAAVGIAHVGVDGRFLRLNDRFCAIAGYTRDELMELTFQDITHPDDLGADIDNVRRILSGEIQTYSMEKRYIRQDRAVIWIQLTVSLARTAAGEPQHFISAIQDITERKQAEEGLRATQARLAAGVDLAGLGFYEVVGGDRVSIMDERFHALFGFPRGMEMGADAVKFWVAHLHPDDAPRIVGVHQQLNDGRLERSSVEYRYRHPEGRELWIHHLAIVVKRDGAGRAARTIGVARDITAQKRVEAELAQQRLQLAHVARISTMGQLASSLAHELNQPLGAILRNAEAAELVLQDPAPDLDEVHAILADIRQDDERAGGVIDRLRVLVRRGEVEFRTLDLGLLAGEVIALLQHDADMRRARLTLEPGPEPSPIRGDRVQLQQVLLNLLLNAMEALSGNPPGNRRVMLRVRRAGEAVELAVSDNGHGIAPGSLLRIFEPFSTTKPNGLGMGLAISRGIIEAHGGRLWAENNAMHGATFTFSLPVAGDEGRGEGARNL